MKPDIEAKLDSIPDDLKQVDHWVCWRYAKSVRNRGHRWCKQPVSPDSGNLAKTTCPDTWTDFGRAATHFQRNQSRLSGIGFVFTDNDPFVGVDLDHCRGKDCGEIAERASLLLGELNSYSEVSPSGTGITIILKSDQKVDGRRRSSPGIEIYSSDRFFTITGHTIQPYEVIQERCKELLKVHKRLFSNAQFPETNKLRVQQETEAATDQQVLQRASTSKNLQKFLSLWNGSTEYHQGNHSEADLSLCRILSFWCGPCPHQIDRLFRRSKLCRPKWDEPHYADGTTYGQMTIAKAILGQEGVFYRWPQQRGREPVSILND